MMHFDRFDICAAYNMYSMLWGGDGCAYENRIQVRLSRIRYRPSHSEESDISRAPSADKVWSAYSARRQT